MHPLPVESHELVVRVTALIQAAKERNERSKRLVPCSRERILWATDLVREREALHDAVAAFARKAHDSGYPPERMLILLKDVVYDAELAETTRQIIVHWSVCAYYAA